LTSELRALPNLGPKSVSWLTEAGIQTLENLQSLGAVGAFLRVEKLEVSPSLNLLWAIEGALHEIPWELIPEERKQQLKEELRQQREST